MDFFCFLEIKEQRFRVLFVFSFWFGWVIWKNKRENWEKGELLDMFLLGRERAEREWV